MAERFAAADASPLIGLAAAGAFGLLRELFGGLVVTAAVRDEIRAGGDRPGWHELAAAIEEGWIEVAPTPPDLETLPELAAGEASTLLLALEHGRCLVVMDETLGRARARALGLPVTGLAGVLLAAKRAGLVERVAPVFERLAARSTFRISGEVVRAALEEAGEA